MTRNQLIQNIQKYLTGTWGLPARLNENEISERIDDALRFFYREYDQALEDKWIVVKKEYFASSEFKDTRKIILPECVEYVAECRISRLTSLFSLGDADLSISRMVAADVFLGSYSSDDMVNRVAFLSYYDLSKTFIRDWVRYDYNPNTKELYIEGGTPDNNLGLRVWKHVDPEKLFNDYLFLDYVRGIALESMGRMMSVFTMSLPGNVSINADMLRSQGTEMIEKVKTKIEENQPSNYILTSH